MKQIALISICIFLGLSDGQCQQKGHFIGLINKERIFATKVVYKTPIGRPNYFEVDDKIYGIDSVREYRNESGYYRRYPKNETNGPRFYQSSNPDGMLIVSKDGQAVTISNSDARNSRIAFYSVDGENLRRLNVNNMMQDMKDSPEAMAYLKKARAHGVAMGILIPVGLVTEIAGIAAEQEDVKQVPGQPIKKNESINAAVPVGFVTFITGLLLTLGRKKNMVKALYAYAANH